MHSQVLALLQRPVWPRIFLVGDVMLDRYVWGDVERISPEAPVPVLHVTKEEHRLGGAGSVASMLAALEARVILAGVTGNDLAAQTVRSLLGQLNVDCQYLPVDPDRMTTVKERYLGRTHKRDPHHMMRVDRETTQPIAAGLANHLLEGLRACRDQIDLVVISDYGKGVCAGDFIPRVVQCAAQAGVGVIADPIRQADYRRYAGCACITPNRTEAGLAAGMQIVTPQDGLEAARRILRFGVQGVAVTLDRDGIVWADQRGNAEIFPARPRQVADVTGAGDMVVSILAYAMAAGADVRLAMEAANLAGGLEVERLGVVPLSRQDLLAELMHGGLPASHKIVSLEQLDQALRRRRLSGQRIVMTNGCFDLLHPGHVASLQEARNQGDCLVVGLNSDQSVRSLKGPGRPIIDQQGRAEMLAALTCVDYVVIFDEPSVEHLVARVLPDVLVKAAQYTEEQVVGHQIVKRHGGHVVSVPMKPHYSTTRLIEKSQRVPGSDRVASG